jgi:hypothetical protein
LFDDTDLHELVEEQTGRRQQRNVIARARGLMENAGMFVRIGERVRDNRKTMHFRLPHRNEVIEHLERELLAGPKPTYEKIETELGWCSTHRRVVNFQKGCLYPLIPEGECTMHTLWIEKPCRTQQG